MDKTLIENWNSVVKPKDAVWVIGDFIWRDPMYYLGQLNGNIYCQLGDHYPAKLKHMTQTKNGFFKIIPEVYEIKPNKEYELPSIILCHWAMRTWPKKFYGAWHLFGHSHGALPPLDRSFDVGVDAVGFYPISVAKVKELMEDQTFLEGVVK
jgi:calcineurin-like phosphoesterase family protein